ncbi:hypothetical protein [Alistipes sp.]|uniref:hypothetical protein n=1 Tax=Alistipes sp. TaxID=1872444 RepID=UPI003AB7209A
MRQKLILRLGVKAWNDTSGFFQELPLSKTSPRTIDITSKEDDNGLYWNTKLSAKLLNDVPLLHDPCIIKVRLRDSYYILGTEELPARPLVKEGDLLDFTLEYKSKSRPQAIKKVLSIAPGCY